MRRISEQHGGLKWTTDFDAALKSAENTVYFDASATGMREENVLRAIAAGKHVYCEKPLAANLESAVRLAKAADKAKICHGVVQDKLFLPGIRKLRRLVDSGFFGRILSVRGEFGYWVFEGDWGIPSQRPSWNYQSENDGGIILDMFAHWRYVLDHVFGAVEAVSCIGATHVTSRVDENGKQYEATADDAAYGTFRLRNGVVAQINSSWTTRVYRDELFVLQVDGTEGSAVAGLRECRTQHRVNTPRPVWNPDVPESNRLPERLGRCARQHALRQCVQSAMGDVSAQPGLGRTISLQLLGWRSRRATRRVGAAFLEGRPLD